MQALTKKCWKAKNRDKQLYYRYHSDTQAFIRKCQNTNQLEDLVSRIKMRKHRLLRTHLTSQHLSINHFINKIIQGDTIRVMNRIPTNSINKMASSINKMARGFGSLEPR